MKDVEFRGTALADLRRFPTPARREAGYQIDRVQHGEDPDDWKPMRTVGQGVREMVGVAAHPDLLQCFHRPAAMMGRRSAGKAESDVVDHG